MYKQIKKELWEVAHDCSYEPPKLTSPRQHKHQASRQRSETQQRLFSQLLPSSSPELDVKQRASKLLQSSSSLHLKSTSNLCPVRKRLSEKARKELRLASQSQCSLDTTTSTMRSIKHEEKDHEESTMNITSHNGLLRHISPRNKYGIDDDDNVVQQLDTVSRRTNQQVSNSSQTSLPVIKNYHLTKSKSFVKYDSSLLPPFTSGSTSRMTLSTTSTSNLATAATGPTKKQSAIQQSIEKAMDDKKSTHDCHVCAETTDNNDKYEPLSKLSKVRGKFYLNIFIPVVINT